MNDLFLFISILSFVGIVIFVILAITHFVKKNQKAKSILCLQVLLDS